MSTDRVLSGLIEQDIVQFGRRLAKTDSISSRVSVSMALPKAIMWAVELSRILPNEYGGLSPF